MCLIQNLTRYLGHFEAIFRFGVPAPVQLDSKVGLGRRAASFWGSHRWPESRYAKREDSTIEEHWERMMRNLWAAVFVLQLMAGSLVADDNIRPTSESSEATKELQLGQRVALAREVQVDADGGETLTLRRGMVYTILAIENGRVQVGDLSPVWIDEGNLLPVRDAIVELNRVVRENPDDAALLLAMADAYRGNAIHDLAIEFYCRVLALDPDNVDAIRGRSESYHFALRSSISLDDLGRFLKAHPDDAVAHYALGYVLACHQEWDDALKSLDASIKLAPSYVQVWIQRAKVKWKRGDIDGAMADYEEAIRLNPNATDAYVGRADYYMAVEKYDQAHADLLKALEVNPRAHAAHEAMAHLILWSRNEEIGDCQKALLHARRASDLTGGQNANYASTLSKAYASVADSSRAADWRIHAMRLKMAQERYYRTWLLDETLRHRKPREEGDDTPYPG